MHGDTRKHLGDQTPSAEELMNDGFVYMVYWREHNLPPGNDYSGEPNESLKKRRPLADLHPKDGTGNVKNGLAFRVPMAGQAMDPDKEDF